MGKISEFFNFDNIGGKIKNLAKWSCWITILLIWIAAPIAFIALVADDWTAYLCWIPLVGAIVGPIFVWVGSWVMYAFGEFVEDVHAIRNKEGTTAEEKARREEALRLKREAEEKAKCEAEEKARRETEEKVDTTSDMPITEKTEQPTTSNLSKATQCECGELHYARYCPVCGKKAETSTSNAPKTLNVEAKPQSKSTVCKCGERFYGDICPNCGRKVKDI